VQNGHSRLGSFLVEHLFRAADAPLSFIRESFSNRGNRSSYVTDSVAQLNVSYVIHS
jgi:hypothetical protein